MAEFGESNRAVEVEIVNKHVVFVGPTETVVSVLPRESELDSDGAPVVGRVMRPYGKDGEDDAKEAEEASKAMETEGPVDIDEFIAEAMEEVEYYALPDELPAEDYLIKQLADRNVELEDKVRDLEEQNQTHQHMETL